MLRKLAQLDAVECSRTASWIFGKRFIVTAYSYLIKTTAKHIIKIVVSNNASLTVT